MATGIPKVHWTTPDLFPFQASFADGISLSYAGKRDASEILATPATPMSTAWASHETGRIKNRLYLADNLGVLSLLLDDKDVAGKVRLIYIDPPYATNSVFQFRTRRDAYADLIVGAQYLEFLRARLILMRELLADDGSLYVHLDDNMAFYVKVLMDEIFGRKNFRNFIVRKKCSSKNYTHRVYGNVADYILFYTKKNEYVWNRPTSLWSDEHADKEYPYVEAETGRRFKKVPVHAPGVRKGETGKPWRGVLPPPGRHWKTAPAQLDELDARGEIYWSANGNPRKKVYLDASAGVAVNDIWLDSRDAHNQNIKITGYPTEKNQDMLRRIVAASSNPGDLVLDAFCGSGTTLAAAATLERRWIGVDNSKEALRASMGRLIRGPRPMKDDMTHLRKANAQKRPIELAAAAPPFVVLTSPSTAPTLSAEIREWVSPLETPAVSSVDAPIKPKRKRTRTRVTSR